MGALPTVTPFPGVPELLRDLVADGFVPAIVTSAPRNYSKAVVESLGFPIRLLVCYQDTAAHKPHPEPILKALELCRVTSRDAVLIGHSSDGVFAARSAGVPTVGAVWGARDVAALKASNPTALAPSVEHLRRAFFGSRTPHASWCYFVDPRHNDTNCVFALGEYRPYRSADGAALNPEFDEFSRQILRLKRRDQNAIRYFRAELDPLLGSGFAIAVVPGHQAGEETPMADVAKALVRRGRFDATTALLRHTSIEKLSKGGQRSSQYHLETTRVSGPEFIYRRRILLLDDIATTGNSLQACRQLLLEAGAASVKCAVLGRTSRQALVDE